MSPTGDYEMEAFLYLPIETEDTGETNYFYYGEHTYKFFKDVAGYFETTKSLCENKGGHLATIKNAEEKNLLVSKCVEDATYINGYTNCQLPEQKKSLW